MPNPPAGDPSCIHLEAGDYALSIRPRLGGSIARMDWRGQSLLRPATGDTILGVSCFPLVPFCNRIRNGHFTASNQEVRLCPNMPGSDHPHALHGFGWQSGWSVADRSQEHARIIHRHEPDEWPWAYQAEQLFRLTPEGIALSLSVKNLSPTDMPCGIGFHPYFERAGARYHGLHEAEWETGPDGLPVRLEKAGRALDWWHGASVEDRSVDTVYAGRRGALSIAWPARNLAVEIQPSAELTHTAVFVPPNADFFCVEPMSQQTDAVNIAPEQVVLLAPAQSYSVSMRLAARALAPAERDRP